MRNSRFLVTGASGKIGSLVVAQLLKAGYRARAMVHREDIRASRLKALGRRNSCCGHERRRER